MKTNNTPLRSNWRSDAFRKPSKRKGTVIVNKSIGRNSSSPVARIDGQLVGRSGSLSGYQY